LGFAVRRAKNGSRFGGKGGKQEIGSVFDQSGKDSGAAENDERYLLVERAVNGDREAFERLYAQERARIAQQVNRQRVAKWEREDIVQEVGLRMYASIGNLKNPHAFRSWLHRIITNTCLNHNRRNDRQSDADINDYEDLLPDDSPAGSPAAAAEADELKRDVMNVIGLLPKKQQTALLMYYYGQMSQEEIAEELHVSAVTVRTNIMRAKRALRKHITQLNS
jgi:RNA polymerase sigma-70 factor (ECF subfamily)